MYKQALTTEAALQKLRHYCGYQERCHQEVKQKLFQLGVPMRLHDEILTTLIEDNYLNEERFAIAYAGGKFRMNDWGRKKIQASLVQKQISSYCIKKAIKKIEESDYLHTLTTLLSKKYASLKDEQYLVRKKRTIDYLLQKGYEPELVTTQIEKLIAALKVKK